MVAGIPGKGQVIVYLPEDSFTNNLAVAIEQVLDSLNSRGGHTYRVGIWVNKGDGDSTSPNP